MTATQSQARRTTQVKNATRSSRRGGPLNGQSSDIESESEPKARPTVLRPTMKRRAPNSDSDDEAMAPRKRKRPNGPVARREEDEEEQFVPHPLSDIAPAPSGEIPQGGDDAKNVLDPPSSGPYSGEIFDDSDDEEEPGAGSGSSDDAAEAALMLSEQPIQEDESPPPHSQYEPQLLYAF